MMKLNKCYNMDCLIGMREMLSAGQKIDCVITDPPYNINYVTNKTGKILNDNLSDKDFKNLLNEYFRLCYALLKDNTFLITFMSWKTADIFKKCLLDNGFDIVASPIWYKNGMGMGYYMRYQYEPMYLGIKGRPVLNKPAISDVILANKVVDPMHSCEKPLNLIYKILNAFTNPGDVVLDGFAGSFTIPLACMKTERNFIAFELDKKCFDMGSQRLQTESLQTNMFDKTEGRNDN